MPDPNLEIIPKEIIRTETALSRFPIHRLSKSGKVSIEIKLHNSNGELTTRWTVKNPPDPLAYKIDTLIINRRIDRLAKPTPKLIKLGTLRELAEEVGFKNTGNTERIKNALIQNALAGITAKFTYKSKDGSEKTTEIADTRYAVVFTGEKLPNGDKADATYILLHDIYREILNSAQTRPLDYDYLKELSPMAQRFYELVSYQVYGALKNRRVAKMIYSEFCTYAPQTRFFDWEQVRPQMHRLHKPHLKSGYIERIEFEKIRADDGTPDWLFTYVAGIRARGEHMLATVGGTKENFGNRGIVPKIKEIRKYPPQLLIVPEEPVPQLVPEVELVFSESEENLISEVRRFLVTESKARSLVKSHREAVEREIRYFPYRNLAGTGNAAGLFVKAVLENYEPPKTYFEGLKVAETKKQTESQAKEAERRAKIQRQEQEAWRQAENRLRTLPETERNRLWELKRRSIMAEPEYKDADAAKLRILESVIDGLVRSSLIEDFIQEEGVAANASENCN